MEQKEYKGKMYNYGSSNMRCPKITIDGKAYCVLKDCFIRAIGGACPPEAPVDWENRANLLVQRWTMKPEEWV